MTPPANRPGLMAIAFLGSWTWAIAYGLAYPNLDPYHDMLESFAWSQTFEWGTFKHPPLFAWVTGVWFTLFPRGELSFKLLAYTNVAVGLLGVAALARAYGMAAHARQVMLLLLICLPYTTLAAKFNANTQLLSVWPWTAAALIHSMTTEGKRAWVWSTCLGLLAALCMLAKYFSGVFLVALAVVALVHPQGKRWMRTALPWWSLALCSLALAPHAWWLHSHGFVLMRYALDQGGGLTDWSQLWEFAVLPLVYWLPGWWLCAAVFAWSAPVGQRLRRWLSLLLRAWYPQGWNDSLFWLVLTPWALSLAFGLAGVVALSSPWAIPLGFAFPLLWLRNLTRTCGPHEATQAASRLDRRSLHLGVLAVVLSGGAVLGISQALQGSTAYYRPTGEAARAIAQSWLERHSRVALGWSTGAWPDTAMMAFYASPTIRALPYAPDSAAAAVAPHAAWPAQGGVWICTLGPAPNGSLTPHEPSNCEQQAVAWLASKGLRAEPRLIVARREGFRFPRPQDWHYVTFDILPSAGKDKISTSSSTSPPKDLP